jgi:hypothetical protein
MHRPARAASMLPAIGLLLGAAVCAQTAFRAPESIRVGLSVMSQVVESTGRLIAAGRYDQLPAESSEFEAGLTALQQGLGDQPSPLRTKIEPLLARARVAASAMSEAVAAHRDSMLPVAHDQLADAVQSIIALFPESLRPAPAGEAAHAPRNIR